MDDPIWTKAATVEDVTAGEGFESEVEIEGEGVALFCVEGDYYALGLCTHEQGPLSQGIVEDGKVTCPWHGAVYDVRTGRCLSGPTACRVDGSIALGEEGDSAPLTQCTTYQVKLESGDLYVRRRR
jgi:nitrite reductase/ring-hydroxylating ferredoxin subunit